MTINHKRKCRACTENVRSESLEEIGTPVHIDGGRSGDTDHTFLQCKECGSVWSRIRDSGGLGGHGTFYHSLTERFY